jgi:hypothetical protein
LILEIQNDKVLVLNYENRAEHHLVSRRDLKPMVVRTNDIVKVESMYHEFVGKALFLSSDSIIVQSLTSQKVEMPFPLDEVFKFSNDGR